MLMWLVAPLVSFSFFVVFFFLLFVDFLVLFVLVCYVVLCVVLVCGPIFFVAVIALFGFAFFSCVVVVRCV